MTDRDHRLSLSRQADLLRISRGSPHHEPRPVSDDDLKLMRRIDELLIDYLFVGSRMMKGLIRQEGFIAGRLHVATSMKRMRIQDLCGITEREIHLPNGSKMSRHTEPHL